MTEAIRILHFADTHIGMENYGKIDPRSGISSRVGDFLARMDEAIDYALQHDADLAVFAGDAFKNRDPEPTQQREFAARIKRLADVMPTLLLVGNHDMPGMAARASSVDIFHALEVPGVIVGRIPEGQVLETKRGPLFLAWMPYPQRNRLLSQEEHGAKSIDELTTALRETVSDILGHLARQAKRHKMPRLLAAHLSVAEARMGSECSVMLGKDVTVLSSTLADAAWDYVALGHIHKHQLLNPGGYPPLVYSGSLERIDFGEEGEEKGFCWVELQQGQTTWQFIPVSARPFKTVKIDVRQAENPTKAALSALKKLQVEDSVVRVCITLRAEQQASLRDQEIRAALSSAAYLTISHEVESEARARLGNLSPEELTPSQLLEQYFLARDIPAERLHALLAKAEELLRDSS
jgi:exonuclease SbcD